MGFSSAGSAPGASGVTETTTNGTATLDTISVNYKAYKVGSIVHLQIAKYNERTQVGSGYLVIAAIAAGFRPSVQCFTTFPYVGDGVNKVGFVEINTNGEIGFYDSDYTFFGIGELVKIDAMTIQYSIGST